MNEKEEARERNEGRKKKEKQKDAIVWKGKKAKLIAYVTK